MKLRGALRVVVPLIALLLPQAWLAVPISAAGNQDLDTQEVSRSGHQASDNNLAQQQADRVLNHVLQVIVNGPAFDAKVRETVWTTGREVVGVGTYEQAGGGSGQYNLQLTMHDGDGKHRLQQISDGRLAWTRTEIAGKVSLRRVDVGRLDQWVRTAMKRPQISPGLRVGGWAEMLTTIQRDYKLRLTAATLKENPVWVIMGELTDKRRKQILADSGRPTWPQQCPTRVRLAVQSQGDPESSFGQWIPIRMEYWSDPLPGQDSSSDAADRGRLITLIELYSLRPITPPPPERFRYENQEAEVNFANETDRYLQHYGIELTERERRQLKR